MADKKTITIAIMDAPYENARSTTTLRLIDLAAKRGYNINVFAYEGAVLQPFAAQTPHGTVAMTNLIARKAGLSGRAVAITGHTDTKILPVRFVGANDGGSSTAVLLELARALKDMSLRNDIWLVFFDGEEAVAQTRAGKQVLTPGEGAIARVCVQADGGDTVGLVGDNRKLLIVKLDDIPLMTRGRGVILQRYKSGGLADCKVFRLADGLAWRQGENRIRTETNLAPWFGARGGAGRLVPNGFPRSGRFA